MSSQPRTVATQREQAFTIRVVGPGILPASRPDSVAYVGVTWRMSLDISDGIQTQIDGGPVLEASSESLVWRPKTGDEGQRVITVSMSGNGAESLVLTFRITVWPRPLIRVDEILVNPIADVNGMELWTHTEINSSNCSMPSSMLWI